MCARVLVCQCKYVCSNSGVVWLIRKTCISYANSARRQPTIEAAAAASQRVNGALESSCAQHSTSQAVQLVQSVQAQTSLLGLGLNCLVSVSLATLVIGRVFLCASAWSGNIVLKHSVDFLISVNRDF
uniref:Uncharacterized protein n=1 Tax=Bactrocera latifrons TaxID=174628 RepID=A0A0K8W1J7_BACLA